MCIIRRYRAGRPAGCTAARRRPAVHLPVHARILEGATPVAPHSMVVGSSQVDITRRRRQARTPDTRPRPPAAAINSRSKILNAASVLTLAAFLIPHRASAQTTQTLAADTRVRTLLSWLDDAEVIEPGGLEISIGSSRWTTQYGHETDAPTIFTAVGVAPRVQLAATGFFYSSAYSDGYTSKGRGDVYLIGKVAVVSPREHPGGVAVSPILEILSDLSLSYRDPGASRVEWGLPVTFQYTTVKVQFIGSTGYFSRGSVFGGAGVQVFVAPNVIASASALYSHATTRASADDELGLKRQRTDVTGGVDVLVSPIVTIFATLGKTVAGTDSTSTTAIGTIGISLRFSKNR